MKPWYKASFDKIDKILQHKRLPHALMIIGDNAIGKLEFAQILIKKLTKIDVNADNLAIDEKNDKILIRHSNYNSLIYCQRELKEKSNKAAQVITVNQVRKFCDYLNKTNDKLQIGIIKYADEMNVSAFNALLKTLEEPRAGTLIILLVHNINNIPATIHSRCQKLNINNPRTEALEWIKHNLEEEIDENIINKLLIENNFVPNLVIKNIKNNDYKQQQIWEQQLLEMVINPNNINDILNIKNNEIKVIKCLQNLLLDCIRLKYTNLQSDDQLKNYIIDKTNNKMLFKLLSDINYAIKLQTTAINMELLLCNILITWSHITHLQSYPSFLRSV